MKRKVIRSILKTLELLFRLEPVKNRVREREIVRKISTYAVTTGNGCMRPWDYRTGKNICVIVKCHL